MEDAYAIEVDHISKNFKIFLDKGHEIKDYVTSSFRNLQAVRHGSPGRML